jgi:hypothetical protein
MLSDGDVSAMTDGDSTSGMRAADIQELGKRQSRAPKRWIEEGAAQCPSKPKELHHVAPLSHFLDIRVEERIDEDDIETIETLIFQQLATIFAHPELQKLHEFGIDVTWARRTFRVMWMRTDLPGFKVKLYPPVEP